MQLFTSPVTSSVSLCVRHCCPLTHRNTEEVQLGVCLFVCESLPFFKLFCARKRGHFLISLSLPGCGSLTGLCGATDKISPTPTHAMNKYPWGSEGHLLVGKPVLILISHQQTTTGLIDCMQWRASNDLTGNPLAYNDINLLSPIECQQSHPCIRKS